MNGDQEKKFHSTINRSSAISIGLVVVIIGAAVWIASSTTRVQAEVEAVTKITSELNEDFVPRRELDQRLSNIEDSVLRIEKYIIK